MSRQGDRPEDRQHPHRRHPSQRMESTELDPSAAHQTVDLQAETPDPPSLRPTSIPLPIVASPSFPFNVQPIVPLARQYQSTTDRQPWDASPAEDVRFLPEASSQSLSFQRQRRSSLDSTASRGRNEHDPPATDEEPPRPSTSYNPSPPPLWTNLPPSPIRTSVHNLATVPEDLDSPPPPHASTTTSRSSTPPPFPSTSRIPDTTSAVRSATRRRSLPSTSNNKIASDESSPEVDENGEPRKRKRRRRATEPPRDQHLRRFLCPVCNKSFARPSAMQIHARSHSDERPFVCPDPSCAREFSVQSNLRRHIRLCHPEPMMASSISSHPIPPYAPRQHGSQSSTSTTTDTTSQEPRPDDTLTRAPAPPGTHPSVPPQTQNRLSLQFLLSPDPVDPDRDVNVNRSEREKDGSWSKGSE
ncbi:hypothetical protein T439DRAFT_125232 [Meredithblackwellia eburnea MCA 4105]